MKTTSLSATIVGTVNEKHNEQQKLHAKFSHKWYSRLKTTYFHCTSMLI